jgi:chromate transporter
MNLMISFLALFGVFFKIGMFTFGGGQAMIPLLQKDLVVNLAWVPMKEFLDFVAISEITPGPVAINMATFVGYKLRGLTGALVTSLGVILPSFIIILVIATVAHTFRTNRWISAFLDGLQPVVLALLTYAVYSIARGGIPAWWGYVASLGILLLILKYGKKLNLFLVLLAAGGLGLLMFR